MKQRNMYKVRPNPFGGAVFVPNSVIITESDGLVKEVKSHYTASDEAKEDNHGKIEYRSSDRSEVIG